MSDLVAGTKILAADYPVAVSEFDETTIANVTTMSYVTGTPVVDGTFVASTSGRVMLTVSLSSRGGGDRILAAPQIFEGVDATGIEVVAPNASLRGVMSCNTSVRFTRWSRITILEGLTPEASYYARFVFRSHLGSGVADLDMRDLSVVPTP